jgi:hypothetical protein
MRKHSRGSSPEAPLGLPFSLSRPVFLIKRTPNASSPSTAQTEILVEWIPDPEQRYAVLAESQLLTEIDFSAELAEDGQLASLNSASREQVTPTITALGQLVAQAAGVAAQAAAFAVEDQLARIAGRINEPSHLDSATKRPMSWVEATKDYKVVSDREQKAWARPETLLTDAFPKSSAFANAFFPRTDAERAWLVTARQRAVEATKDECTPAFETCSDACKTKDEPARTECTSACVTDRKRYEAHSDSALDARLLDTVLKMPQREVRNRHAACLEAGISFLKLSALSSVAVQKPKWCAPAEGETVATLEREWDKTVDVGGEAARVEMLKKYLKREPAPTRGGKGPPFADQDLARQQLAELATAIANKRAALRGKVEEETLRPLALWRDEKTSAEEITGDPKVGLERPPYVIVVEKGWNE